MLPAIFFIGLFSFLAFASLLSFLFNLKPVAGKNKLHKLSIVQRLVTDYYIQTKTIQDETRSIFGEPCS